jgi:hypothetical protein
MKKLLIFAEWIDDSSEDLMPGTVSRVALLEADAYRNTIAAPLLIIRYDGSEYDIYVAWRGCSMERGDVTVRLGDSEPRQWVAALSTDGESTFIQEWKRFIAAMLDADEMVIQAESATGVMSIARFDLTDFDKALMTLDGEGDM